jgi:hypothetical protein
MARDAQKGPAAPSRQWPTMTDERGDLLLMMMGLTAAAAV